jgi:hypothetical protein
MPTLIVSIIAEGELRNSSLLRERVIELMGSRMQLEVEQLNMVYDMVNDDQTRVALLTLLDSHQPKPEEAGRLVRKMLVPKNVYQATALLQVI